MRARSVLDFPRSVRGIISVLAGLLATGLTAQKQAGDESLNSLFRKMETRYYFPGPQMTPWAEGKNLLFIGDSPDASACEILLIALKDSTLIGIYKNRDPRFFMFDTDGDSELRMTSEYFFLPLWVVKRKTRLLPEDRTILTMLDRFYQCTLQNDVSARDTVMMRQFERYRNDAGLANRHIALLFDTYMTIISETSGKGMAAPAEVSNYFMQALSGQCLDLFHELPVLVCIYMGEALQNAKQFDKAKEHFRLSLKFYPNSIPLQVYNYRYEDDVVKKKQMLAELKAKHPGHWMVREL